MRAVLEKGLRSGAIEKETLLELSMRLFNGYGCHPSKHLIKWMENDWGYFQMYIRHDPKIRDVIYSLSVDSSDRRGGEKIFDDVEVVERGNGSRLNDDSLTTPLI